MKEFQVYFDGGIRPHPEGGFARCYGWVIKADGNSIKEGRAIEIGKDNVGSCSVEFDALARAVLDMVACVRDAESISIYGDSRAVIDMCTGIGHPHTDDLLSKHTQISEMTRTFENLKFIWIPRELNAEADKLGRIAFAEHTQQNDRIHLMNKVNVLARRYFGALYDSAIMTAWCLAMIGKRKLTNMSVGELSILLNKVREIPRLISVSEHLSY